MSRTFQTQYQALNAVCDETVADDEEEEEQEEDQSNDNDIVQIVSDQSRSRWNHIEDLDEFFTRVYQYHQRSGFFCMIIQDLLQLIQFMFVILFSTFLMTFVDYEKFFGDDKKNQTQKITIEDIILPREKALARFNAFICLCLAIASVLWIFRFLKIVYHFFKYLEIRSFYVHALKITSNDLVSLTWHEVQRRLLDVQKELQMCIHKPELTELDVYHRMLRFKNYLIAMVNKSLLPIVFDLPFVGKYAFMTTGLKYNLEMILFWGPWAPFENNWHLKKEYKVNHKRKELADQLSGKILFIGIANLVLSPIIFFWQIFYSFFRYAEVVKREPSMLGSRHWSLYSRIFLRHFNELDHEFNARLSRGYRPAEKYMNIFLSPLLAVIAKHLAFICGSILAVLIILTIIDEDVLNVEHIIGMMTILGVIITICRVLIPDEYMIFCPELLMRAILAQIHYIPDSWKGQAHTYAVRSEFSQLFQYKVVYLLEELFSPIFTPFILIFALRHKSQDIVDFYHNFTVDVTGVGDVCSFAQMNIKKHGHPEWEPETNKKNLNRNRAAENGKTELSLMHFTLTNPEWRLPEAEDAFINTLRSQVQRDNAMFSLLPLDNPLLTSSHSLTGQGYNSLLLSTVHKSLVYPSQPYSSFLSDANPSVSVVMPTPSSSSSSSSSGATVVMRGGVRNLDYPMNSISATGGLLSSVNQRQSNDVNRSSSLAGVMSPNDLLASGFHRGGGGGGVSEGTLELLSAEMSFNALYLHDLHVWKKLNKNNVADDEDDRARRMWQVPTTAGGVDSPPSPPKTTSVRMPNIQEGSEEDEVTTGGGGGEGVMAVNERDYLLDLDAVRNYAS